MAGILLAGAIVIPISVSLRGVTVFRLPNQLSMYAVAICALVIAVSGMLWRPDWLQVARRARSPFLLAVAALLWTAVSIAFSLDRALSLQAVPFIAAVFAIGVIAAFAFRSVPVSFVAVAIGIPVVANVAVITLQASRLWNPWVFADPYWRMHKNALLGNPNDVGAYLAGPLIFGVAMALGSHRHRHAAVALAVASAAGILISETLTAIGSSMIGTALVVILHNRRRGLAIVGGIVLAFCVTVVLYEPLERRVRLVSKSVMSKDIDRVLSARLPAFVTAWKMFVDDPITGVGPGVFKREYMRYRVGLDAAWRDVFTMPYSPVNEQFAEVHNDHLQLLAETGLPGYALMLCAFVLVARISFTPISDSADERVRVARLLALPVTVTLAFTMLTGFPLQLAAPASTFALLGGLCLAWSSTKSDAGISSDAT